MYVAVFMTFLRCYYLRQRIGYFFSFAKRDIFRHFLQNTRSNAASPYKGFSLAVPFPGDSCTADFILYFTSNKACSEELAGGFTCKPVREILYIQSSTFLYFAVVIGCNPLADSITVRGLSCLEDVAYNPSTR